jgi:NAD+ kinase
MIGVVGPDADVGSFEDAIADAGETSRSGPATDVIGADPDAVVAVGEAGVIDLVRSSSDVAVPVLAVGVAAGHEGDPRAGSPVVSGHEATSAIEALASGRFETVQQPVLAVDVGEERAGRAAFDAMVVTSDPVGISEYGIVAGRELGTVRADGVVVATPAGSHGYARAAGGSRIVADAPVATVVPVAPFTMTPERWVVDLDSPVEITTERDVDVSLVLDDERREIRSEATVSIGLGGTLSCVVPE